MLEVYQLWYTCDFRMSLWHDRPLCVDVKGASYVYILVNFRMSLWHDQPLSVDIRSVLIIIYLLISGWVCDMTDLYVQMLNVYLMFIYQRISGWVCDMTNLCVKGVQMFIYQWISGWVCDMMWRQLVLDHSCRDAIASKNSVNINKHHRSTECLYSILILDGISNALKLHNSAWNVVTIIGARKSLRMNYHLTNKQNWNNGWNTMTTNKS